jgi:Uncharacterized ACR, COG1993
MGFGHSSKLHTAKVLRLSFDLPIVVEIVDTRGQTQRVLADSRCDDGSGLSLGIFLQWLELRPEPNLRDEGGHHRATDHGRHENGVLRLIDDVVGEPEQRRDRAEGQPRRHHQGRIHPLALVELEVPRQRQDAGELGRHLDQEEKADQACAGDERVSFDQRASLEKIKRRQEREADSTEPELKLPLSHEEWRQRHPDQVSR